MSTHKNEIDQPEINKNNSQHSGPKTAEAKKQGQLVAMPTEDLAAYYLHLKSFTDEYIPKGATEANLVQALADTSWRLNRIAALETNLLIMDIAGQFNPFSDSPQQGQDGLSIVTALERQSKAFANLSMHSQRLSRQFERTVAQLRDLQKTRRAQEKHDLDNFLDITEMYEAKGETYDPSEEGYVFSQGEIDDAIRARNRERLTDQALDYRNDAAA